MKSAFRAAINNENETEMGRDFNYKNIQLPNGDRPYSGVEPPKNALSKEGFESNEDYFNQDTPEHENKPAVEKAKVEEEKKKDEIPEWEKTDGYFPHHSVLLTDHPVKWAFSRLYNKIIDQVNWFIKYVLSAIATTDVKEPDAGAVIFAFLLMIIVFVVQLIFLLPNLVSYISEGFGICFAAVLFELFDHGEQNKDKYRNAIDASIEGMNSIVGTFVAFMITLNLWYGLAVRKSDTNVSGILKTTMTDTVFELVRHGLAGPLMILHLFGRMKMGLRMDDTEDGGANMLPNNVLGAMGSSSFVGGVVDAAAKRFESLLMNLEKMPTVFFMILYLIVVTSFSGGMSKIMNSQNSIKSLMGDSDTNQSQIWYVILIFCILCTASSLISALPKKYNPISPYVSLFYMLIIVIATLISFQFGSILAIMIIVYFMFLVLPVEEFGNIKIAVNSIFVSFKMNPPPGEGNPYMQFFMHYGVILLLCASVILSFIALFAKVSSSIPTTPQIVGGMFVMNIACIFGIMYLLYKFVFPNNLKDAYDEFYKQQPV